MAPFVAQAALPDWHPHWDVWLILFVLGFSYVYAIRRIAPHLALTGPPVTAPPESPSSTRTRSISWMNGCGIGVFSSGTACRSISAEGHLMS